MYDGLVRLTGRDRHAGIRAVSGRGDAHCQRPTRQSGRSNSATGSPSPTDRPSTPPTWLPRTRRSSIPLPPPKRRSSYDMISDVVAVDDNTVEFRLAYSYAPLLTKMLIGMVPSESLATTRTCRRIAVEHRACRYGSVHTRRSLTGSSGLRGERELLGRCTGDQEAHSPLRSGRQHPRPTYGVRRDRRNQSPSTACQYVLGQRQHVGDCPSVSGLARSLTSDEQSRGRRQSRTNGAQPRPPIASR